MSSTADEVAAKDAYTGYRSRLRGQKFLLNQKLKQQNKQDHEETRAKLEAVEIKLRTLNRDDFVENYLRLKRTEDAPAAYKKTLHVLKQKLKRWNGKQDVADLQREISRLENHKQEYISAYISGNMTDTYKNTAPPPTPSTPQPVQTPLQAPTPPPMTPVATPLTASQMYSLSMKKMEILASLADTNKLVVVENANIRNDLTAIDSTEEPSLPRNLEASMASLEEIGKAAEANKSSLSVARSLEEQMGSLSVASPAAVINPIPPVEAASIAATNANALAAEATTKHPVKAASISATPANAAVQATTNAAVAANAPIAAVEAGSIAPADPANPPVKAVAVNAIPALPWEHDVWGSIPDANTLSLMVSQLVAAMVEMQKDKKDEEAMMLCLRFLAFAACKKAAYFDAVFGQRTTDTQFIFEAFRAFVSLKPTGQALKEFILGSYLAHFANGVEVMYRKLDENNELSELIKVKIVASSQPGVFQIQFEGGGVETVSIERLQPGGLH